MVDYISGGLTWFFGLLTPAQWDAWRNWLATIGGLVGLSIVVATFRGNLRARRIEQARLVYARIDRIEYREAGQSFRITPGKDANHPQIEADIVRGLEMVDGETQITVSARSLMLIITVHNGSKERVGPIRLEYYNDAMRSNMKLHNGINLIGPETEYPLAAIMANPLEGQPSVSALIRFEDSSGRWWKRFRDEPVRPGRRVKAPGREGRYWVPEPAELPGVAWPVQGGKYVDVPK
jgi:hypothetical protein